MSKLLALMQRHGIASFTMAAVLAFTAATVVLHARHQTDLLETANKLGPSAKSIVQGQGLAICYGPQLEGRGGITCFHAQRMPLAPLILAGLYFVFHDHTLAAAACKALLFLAPVILMFALVWRSLAQEAGKSRWPILGLFLLTLLLPPMLDLAVNLNFEEAYFYSWLALAVALLLLSEVSHEHPRRWAFAIWLCLTLTFLTKSSMLPATSFLAVMAAVYLAREYKPALAAALLLACVCVPLTWGAYLHHTSGRFTVGTSLDGVNLYKGNNPGVLGLYPAFRGASLDQTEASLLGGNVALDKEWDENDFALAHARNYMRANPAATIQADLRKASVFFLGVQRNLGEEPYPAPIEASFDAGLLLFRLMLWAALALALRNLLAAPGKRFPALVFLGLVACTAIPYVIGFALTRHALVLILPAAAYLSTSFAGPRVRSPTPA